MADISPSSLTGLIDQARAALRRAADLIPANPPPPATLNTTTLAAAHQNLRSQQTAAAPPAFSGTGAHTYTTALRASTEALADYLGADHTLAAGYDDAAASARAARAKLNSIVYNTDDGFQALLPTTNSATGRDQLATYLHHQLGKARTVLTDTQHDSSAAASVIQPATAGYRVGPNHRNGHIRSAGMGDPFDDFEKRRLWTDKDLYPHEPSAADIKQKSIGDCYFDATMGAIAHANPQWIKDRIQYDPKTGTFDVTLWNGHAWQHITVTQDDIGTDINHHGASWIDRDHPNAPLWPAVLESAYAKLHNPDQSLGQALDYGIGKGGSAPDALQALTGNRGVNIDPRRVWFTDQHIDQAISTALAHHQPVTIATTDHGGPLVGPHVYIVEGIDGVGSDARLTLRNPWEDNPREPGNPLITVRLGDVIGSGPTGGFDRHNIHHPAQGVNIGELPVAGGDVAAGRRQ